MNFNPLIKLLLFYHKVKTYLSSLLLGELFSVSKFTCSPKKESEKLKNSHFGQIHQVNLLDLVVYRLDSVRNKR